MRPDKSYNLTFRMHRQVFPEQDDISLGISENPISEGVSLPRIGTDLVSYLSEFCCFELFQLSSFGGRIDIEFNPSPTVFAAKRINYRQLLIRRPR